MKITIIIDTIEYKELEQYISIINSEFGSHTSIHVTNNPLYYIIKNIDSYNLFLSSLCFLSTGKKPIVNRLEIIKYQPGHRLKFSTIQNRGEFCPSDVIKGKVFGSLGKYGVEM